MHTFLQKLSLINFRNYEEASLEFSSKINCFAGNNGVGKTNILDSIHYLSLCKSFFNNSDAQNIRHDQPFFVIQGEFSRDEKPENIYCGVKIGQKKMFRRNGKEYDRLAEHIGLIPVVIISPNDTNLILGGSEERRKFLDMVISQFDPNYLELLLRYNRTLIQRNQLLKNFALQNFYDEDMLGIWNEQMIPLAIKIYHKRLAFIEGLIPVFQQFYEFVSEGKEIVTLHYDSQLADKNFESSFLNALDRDRKLQFTTIGIHKDDLNLKLGEYPLKRVASQGQQKTFLVSLKLAQFEFIKKNSGNLPILLLDDIFDKFDETRVQKIIQLVSGNNFGQIFITDTHLERIYSILQTINVSFKLYLIEKDGRISLHSIS